MDWFLQSRAHFETFVLVVCVVGTLIAAGAVLFVALKDARHRRMGRALVASCVSAIAMGAVLSAQTLANYCAGLEPYSFWWWAGGCWGLP